MQTITRRQVVEALHDLGISSGDGLLVHSAVQFLGRPEGGLGMYLQALDDVLGLGLEASENFDGSNQASLHQGTLAVPAFNFALARGERFDPQTSPAQGMGAFSEYVRQHPAARRTPHPLQSLAVIGAAAADLAGRNTPGAFDPGSAFERMLELDFKLVLLGADIQAVSMLHYSEQRLQVPYRYWKEFRGPVLTVNGWQEQVCRMYVRDLELDPRIELYPVQAELARRGRWFSRSVNYGQISACRLVDFVTALEEFLRADPWSLVINRNAGDTDDKRPAN